MSRNPKTIAAEMRSTLDESAKHLLRGSQLDLAVAKLRRLINELASEDLVGAQGTTGDPIGLPGPDPSRGVAGLTGPGPCPVGAPGVQGQPGGFSTQRALALMLGVRPDATLDEIKASPRYQVLLQKYPGHQSDYISTPGDLDFDIMKKYGSVMHDFVVDAIRKHHADRGNDRCWENDVELYRAVGLEPGEPQLPPIDEHCRMCDKYRFGLYGADRPQQPWIAIRLNSGWTVFTDDTPPTTRHDGFISVLLTLYGVKNKPDALVVPSTHYHGITMECNTWEDFVRLWDEKPLMYEFTPTQLAAMARFKEALRTHDKEVLADYNFKDYIVC